MEFDKKHEYHNINSIREVKGKRTTSIPDRSKVLVSKSLMITLKTTNPWWDSCNY